MTPEATADMVLRMTAEKRALAEEMEAARDALSELRAADQAAIRDVAQALDLPADEATWEDVVTEITRLRTELHIEAAPPAGAEDYYVVSADPFPHSLLGDTTIWSRGEIVMRRQAGLLDDVPADLFDLVVSALRLPVAPDEVSA